MDMTQCGRHGYAIKSRGGIVIGWTLTIALAKAFPEVWSIVNVQNGTEVFIQEMMHALTT